jgi:hypothetical protein
MDRPIPRAPARPRLIRIMAILGVALTTCTGCVPAPVDGALRVGVEASGEATYDCPRLKIFEGDLSIGCTLDRLFDGGMRQEVITYERDLYHD